MEEHRAGGAPSYRHRLTPRGTRPGEWVVKFTPCQVFITDASSPIMQHLVGELTGIGFHVSFSLSCAGADQKTVSMNGARLAQKTASQYLPYAPAPAASMLTIEDTPGGLRLSRSGATIDVTRPANESTALHILLQTAVILANYKQSGPDMLQNMKIEAHSS